MTENIHAHVTGISVLDPGRKPFEGQYPVPDGITYNTYLVRGEKTALLDTVDADFSEAWLRELAEALGGAPLDYLVVSHMEPDHSGSIRMLTEAYPGLTIVGNAKTFGLLDQFCRPAPAAARLTVKDGETLSLGGVDLRFLFAPMVHWPEVMLCFDETDGILFSADAFGTFGGKDALEREDYEAEARRYYANIVGKYGAQVQGLLKKAAALPVECICPLHGPVLAGGLKEPIVSWYGAWSAWQPAEEGVLIVTAGFHGNTRRAGEALEAILREKGADVTLVDLSRMHASYAVGQAFRCPKIVLAAATYDGALAPAMEALIASFKAKSLQNRTFALIENGSWGPLAAKKMREALEGLKGCAVLDGQVTVRSSLSDANLAELEAMAGALLGA